jgi:hypothetical protein
MKRERDGPPFREYARAGQPGFDWTVRYDYEWPRRFGLRGSALNLGGDPRTHYAMLVALILFLLQDEIEWSRRDALIARLNAFLGSLSGWITLNYDLVPEMVLPVHAIDYGLIGCSFRPTDRFLEDLLSALSGRVIEFIGDKNVVRRLLKAGHRVEHLADHFEL